MGIGLQPRTNGRRHNQRSASWVRESIYQDHPMQQGSLQWWAKSRWNLTLKAMTDGQNNDENQGNDDTGNDQFYLHVMNPHLPFHFSSLRPEILSLK